VLETRSVRRLGESQARAIDVRLVAATNRKLPQEVAAGRFREDLYFRLGVIRVRMPSLRERKEEVPRLVAHFLSELGRDPNEGLPNPSMMAMLEQYPWPGNVRELRNVVERLVVLPGMQPEFYLDGESAVTTGSAAADAAAQSADRVELDRGFHEGKQRATERFERAYLAQQLARCRGNISELARVSGLSRQSCHRLLTRHDINSHDVGNQNVGTKQGKP